MRSSFLKKIIAGTVMCTALFSLAPTSASAAWVQDYFGSWIYTEGYSVATGWRLIGGTWYYFNNNGIMQTGWIYTNGTWYYADASGAMQTGIIQVNNKIYILASSGAMQTGTVIVNGKAVTLDYTGAAIGANIPMPAKAFDWQGQRVHSFIPEQIIDLNPAASDSASSDTDDSEFVEKFKVRYKDDDGDDLKTKTVEDGDKITLYEPSKNGYEFVEWNTKKNGKGIGYDADEKIKITEDLTLYAQWKEEEEEETVKVKTITLSGASNLSTITTKGGTLQIVKKVTPSSATNATVTWAVQNVTGQATISSTGKLTAVKNGTVKVTATSKDGSKVVGSMTVTISGQDA